jgi:hypothetical protein
MATYNKFNSFPQKLTDKAIAMNADTFKFMLSNTAPVATNAVKTDITQISGVNGYTTDGTATTITESAASGTVTEKGTAVTWTASGGSIGPLRYVVFYDSTTSDLIGWWDYGSSITLNSGDTFTVTPDATNGIFQLS